MAELVILAFALAALVVGMLSPEPEIGDLAINFVAILLEAMPFMMVGAIIGGIIEVFVPAEFVHRALAGRTKSYRFRRGGPGDGLSRLRMRNCSHCAALAQQRSTETCSHRLSSRRTDSESSRGRFHVAGLSRELGYGDHSNGRAGTS